jgi:hypothetical protein
MCGIFGWKTLAPALTELQPAIVATHELQCLREASRPFLEQRQR